MKDLLRRNFRTIPKILLSLLFLLTFITAPPTRAHVQWDTCPYMNPEEYTSYIKNQSWHQFIADFLTLGRGYIKGGLEYWEASQPIVNALDKQYLDVTTPYYVVATHFFNQTKYLYDPLHHFQEAYGQLREGNKTLSEATSEVHAAFNELKNYGRGIAGLTGLNIRLAAWIGLLPNDNMADHLQNYYYPLVDSVSALLRLFQWTEQWVEPVQPPLMKKSEKSVSSLRWYFCPSKYNIGMLFPELEPIQAHTFQDVKSFLTLGEVLSHKDPYIKRAREYWDHFNFFIRALNYTPVLMDSFLINGLGLDLSLPFTKTWVLRATSLILPTLLIVRKIRRYLRPAQPDNAPGQRDIIGAMPRQ